MSLVAPPAFNEKVWPGEHRLPSGYKGIKFTFKDFMERVQMELFASHATILRTKVKIRFWHAGSKDGNHPLTFEVDGKKYDYAFFLWANRLVIITTDTRTSREASTMFPVTIAELERALSSVVEDAL